MAYVTAALSITISFSPETLAPLLLSTGSDTTTEARRLKQLIRITSKSVQFFMLNRF
jgi:hypothetical protein